MHADIAPDLHADPGARVDAVQTRLRSAPDTESGGEPFVHWAGERQSTVDEEVVAAHANDAALQVRVEAEPPRHRPLIDAAFEEQGEIVAPVAELPEPLPPFGGDPHRNAGDRLDSDASGEFAPAATYGRAGPEGRRDLAREIVGEARPGLAGAERSVTRERTRSGDSGLLAA